MPSPYRVILVALACDESDRTLLAYAAGLARAWPDAAFHLMHVLPAPPSSSRHTDAARTRLLASLPADLIAAAAGRTTTSVEHGDRLDALLRFAVAEKVDLVLLGHRRESRGRRSTARRLAMKAPCSIWLVPEGALASLERILAPIDFSPRAADALQVATSVAESAGLDELDALHVRFNPASVTFDEYADIEMANEHDAFALFVGADRSARHPRQTDLRGRIAGGDDGAARRGRARQRSDRDGHARPQRGLGGAAGERNGARDRRESRARAGGETFRVSPPLPGSAAGSARAWARRSAIHASRAT